VASEMTVEQRIQEAFLRFDARRKGIGEWKDRPQSERDAFKAEARALVLMVKADIARKYDRD
jgi:hypothetical protein